MESAYIPAYFHACEPAGVLCFDTTVRPNRLTVNSLRYMDRECRLRHLCRLAPACKFDAHALASTCQISFRQLERYVTEDFGRTLREWLTEQKMLAATHMLLESEFIKGVSSDLGYSRADNFARDFRRVHGLSPTDFLRQHARIQPSVAL